MASNNFRVNVVARALLLSSLLTGGLYSIFIAHWVVTPVLLLAGAVAAMCELIVYVEKTNREFTRFLLAIKSADFSRYSVSDKRGKSFSDFKKALNIIIDEFQRVRIEKEASLTFIQTAVEHINTAIISFDKQGEITLINQAAKDMLHLPYLKNIYSLQKINEPLCSYLTGTQTGRNPILEIEIKGEQLKLSFRSTDFMVQGIQHRLISIQNIKAEIEHKELDAWEQLLRVLTHEIMNSITPLSSLSVTLKNKADALLDKQRFDQETVDDLSQGLNVIVKRSNGLMNFVNHYRSLTMLPTPEFREVEINYLLEGMLRLKQEELNNRGIEIKLSKVKTADTIKIDQALIDQVLINLINNAADALGETTNPLIVVDVQTINNKNVIRVSDNGPGIAKDNLDRIFIPFFTTRNNGSGIGLSLSRQIMRMHGGSIGVNSAPGNGATFSLEFP